MWLKLDDDFNNHPKIRAAGRESAWLHVVAMLDSAKFSTNGFVPRSSLGLHAHWYDDDETGISMPALVDQLVEVGLWEAAEGGWQIHDFLDYNPSGDEVRSREQSKTISQLLRGQTEAIRMRDNNTCRYAKCGRQVNWRDKRSRGGGVYDLVDHDQPVTANNAIVACRGCRDFRGGRTLKEAKMRVIDA